MAETGPTNAPQSSTGTIFDYAPAPESRSVLDLRSSYGLFIDGEFVDPVAGSSFKTISPASEEVLAEVAEADAADVDLAVRAARRAYTRTWSRLSGRERGKYLFRIARILQERSRELAVLESLDNGKPIRESRDVDLPLAAAHFFYYAGWADKLAYAGFGPDPRPLGVAGQVIPWNFPLLMLAWKVAPALATGNTVVLKPAETTPLTALLFAEVCQQAELPAGVVNIVTGAGATGQALVAHPDVDKVAFTGSTEVGKAIARTVAGTDKRVTLELGGKSAAILLDDADLQAVVPALAGGVCAHAGQGCAQLTRLLVPRARYEEAIAIAAAVMPMIPWGDPTDPRTVMGPVVNARQRDNILRYIQSARDEGGRIAVGGEPVDREKGFFVPPTLIADVDPKSTVAQEEIFGPVLVVLPYDDEEDAIRIADSTIFGLSGAVYSADPARAMAVARRLRTGTVGVNGAQWFDVQSPFGGYKQSGLGREWGNEGLEDFLEVKTIAFPAVD